MARASNYTLHNADLISSRGEANERFLDLKFHLDNTLRPIDGYQNAPSLSLEQSLARVIDQVYDLPRYIRSAKTSCKQPIPNDFTLDQAAAIRLYTMECGSQSLYFVLNQELRNLDREKLKPWFAYLKLLMTALYRLRPQPLSVYRGIKGDISKQYRKGALIIWWGFSSCTTSVEVLQTDQFLGTHGVRTLFYIECFSGRDITQHSNFPHEGEILLPPGRQFLVTEIKRERGDLYIVHLKEQVPVDPLIAPPFDLPVTSPSDVYPLLSKPCGNRKLADILKKHLPILETASLNINDDDMRYVAQSVQENQSCSYIDLSSNIFTLASMTSVDIMLRSNGSIETLDMCTNQLSDHHIAIIIHALRYRNTLVHLNLAENNITDAGLHCIVEFLQHNESLQSLNLNSNEISDSGISELSNVLFDRQFLKQLYLSRNQITDISSVTVIQIIKQNRSLIRLDLDDNKFTTNVENRLRQEAVAKGVDFVLALGKG